MRQYRKTKQKKDNHDSPEKRLKKNEYQRKYRAMNASSEKRFKKTNTKENIEK